MNDPLGTILLAIRAYAGVVALVSDVSTKVTTVAADPPAVRLRQQSVSRLPFGPGSGRVGLQLWSGIAQCYGADNRNGEQAAFQLAGEVSDALHGLGQHRGSGGNLILRAWTPTIDEITRDPDTKWPVATVRIEVYAATSVQT